MHDLGDTSFIVDLHLHSVFYLLLLLWLNMHACFALSSSYQSVVRLSLSMFEDNLSETITLYEITR